MTVTTAMVNGDNGDNGDGMETVETEVGHHGSNQQPTTNNEVSGDDDFGREEVVFSRISFSNI
jgi:hypothetical protein